MGAEAPAGSTALIVGDLDNDGWFDLAIAGAAGLEVRANNGDGTFRRAGQWGSSADALQLGDMNNDGWLDLVASNGEIFANAGGFQFAPAPNPSMAGSDLEVFAVADRNGDGALDLVGRSGNTVGWWEQAAPLGNWARVALTGVKNNLRGIGATVESKAGGLYQRRLQRGRWLHFGLGGEPLADVVRVTWPNGIIQNETDVSANQALGPVGEVERLEGSCPLLYTWDGEQWVFINEVLGVAPLGMPLAAGVIHPADYDEYVPVPGTSIRSADGEFEIRLTEELRETGYVDAVRLLAVDHPTGVGVVPDERFIAPPHPEFALYATARQRPVEAVDGAGRDWSAALAAVDGNWATPFERDLYEGLATEHSLELNLADAREGADVRLLLTGWVYWATGSINLQVDQDPRVRFAPVQLQVPDRRGGWRTAIADIGLPNAKNSTLVVEVGEHLVSGDPRVRLTTTMRLYWDAATYAVGEDAVRYEPRGAWRGEWGTPLGGSLELVATAASGEAVPRVHVLEPHAAAIRWRGFSALQRGADGFETFAYAEVAEESNWNQHRGNYTRYGAVEELVADADDQLVIIGTGDELMVRFADNLPPLPPGWERQWLVYLNGWVKDGDPNTVGGDRVEPLPYHSMPGYPYTDAADPAMGEDWRTRYNTRPARSVNPALRPRR